MLLYFVLREYISKLIYIFFFRYFDFRYKLNSSFLCLLSYSQPYFKVLKPEIQEPPSWHNGYRYFLPSLKTDPKRTSSHQLSNDLHHDICTHAHTHTNTFKMQLKMHFLSIYMPKFFKKRFRKIN